MKDIQQVHFQSKKHRYSEELLLNPPLHVQQETQYIINRLKGYKVRTVVDFGSGNGRLTIPLLQAGFVVTAVDISKESLDRLMAMAEKMNCAQHLSCATHFPRGPFDAVVGTDILHHVDINRELHTMRKALHKSGVLIFSEPNILNISWTIFISLFLDWHVEKGIVFCNYFTLRKLLTKHSFRVITITGHGLFPPPLFNRSPFGQMINYFFGNLPFCKLFAYRLIISAQV